MRRRYLPFVIVLSLFLLGAAVSPSSPQDAIPIPLFPTDPFSCLSSSEGSLYMNSTSHTPYVCDATSWTSLFPPPPVPVTHNLLSTTHPDTTPGSVARGDLITGNSTPAWSRLPIGAANRYLTSDGTDTSWSTVDLSSSGVSNILPFSSGGTGLSTAADDTTLVSTGSSWQAKSIPDCTDVGGAHLNYTAASNSYSCGTSSSSSGITGSGTTNTIAKFTGSSTVGNSGITDSSSSVTVASFTSTAATVGSLSGSWRSASPGTTTYGGIDASGTDATAAALNVVVGRGTGTGSSGRFQAQMAPPSTTGSTLNTPQTFLDVLGSNGQLILGAVPFGSSVTPGSVIVRGHTRTGTDLAGGQTIVSSGASTGTGVGGNLNFQVTMAATASGSTANTFVTAGTISGTDGSITFGNLNVPSGAAGNSQFLGANAASGRTDTAGGQYIFAGGKGTGTGAGGPISFQVAPAASSTGTTQNALATYLLLSQATITLGGVALAISGNPVTVAGFDRSGTDLAAADLTLRAGRGTGTGNGGNFNAQIATAGPSTGSSLNTTQSFLIASGTTGGVAIGGVGRNNSPGASSFQGANRASGQTDGFGGNLALASGVGTGAGASGTVRVQLAPAASSTGTTQNALVDIETWAANAVTDPQLRTATFSGPNGGTMVRGVATELLTLSTGATTTDTTNNLLPAGAIIEAVTTRVTTAITTCVNFSVGDATTAARFSASTTGTTLGATRVGLQHMQGSVATDAAGPVQVSAAKIRVTCDLTAGAGAIRIQVWYRQFTAPTS